MQPANWNKDEMGPSTLLGLSSHTPHHTTFSYFGNSVDRKTNENDTHTQRLQEYNQPRPQGQIRNPDSLGPSTEKIVIANERDVYGRLVVTHSYNEGGQLFHRKYTFTDAELNQFIQQHPRIPVQSDGGEQVKHCDSNQYVEVEHSPTMSSQVFNAPNLMKSNSSTIPTPYDTPLSAGLVSPGDFSYQMSTHDQSRNQHNTLPRSGC